MIRFKNFFNKSIIEVGTSSILFITKINNDVKIGTYFIYFYGFPILNINNYHNKYIII